MNTEDEIKRLIESKYGNVKNFSIQNNIPYTTVRSILERGILNDKVENVIKMADGLGVKAEDLFSGEIEEEFITTIETIYNKLSPPRQAKVYQFAEYQLKEQNKPRLTFILKGYVSAGTGEWLEETNEACR